MRGGSIPLLAWALLLLVLFAGNWIYQGDPVQTAQSAAAVGVIALWGLAGIALSGREAVRRGPPRPQRDAGGVPDISFGAAGAGFALATLVFGLVWGHFLVYFGAGLLVLSLGRLGLELRAERRTLRFHRSAAHAGTGLDGERAETTAQGAARSEEPLS